jgi:hypothetical protein
VGVQPELHLSATAVDLWSSKPSAYSGRLKVQILRGMIIQIWIISSLTLGNNDGDIASHVSPPLSDPKGVN